MDWKSLIDINGHARIPNSVTVIGQQAFEGCTGLTSISTHTKKENPEEIAETINNILERFPDHTVILYVPIGTGYAYRHYPYVRKLKEVIIEK